MYTSEDFAREHLAAVENTNPQRRAHQVLQRALRSPDLFNRHEATLANREIVEFHFSRSPEAAIKVFCLHGAEGPKWAHDHGGLWGVYGAYRGQMAMSFYKEVRPGVLEERERLLFEQGETILIYPSDVHALWSPQDGSILLTAYNGDLNSVERRIYDLDQGYMIRDRSQWQARRKVAGGLRKIDEADPGI